MDIVFIVQRRPLTHAPIQAKGHNQPVDPLPQPAFYFKVVDTRTSDCIDEFEDEASAQARCFMLNAQLPQNKIPLH